MRQYKIKKEGIKQIRKKALLKSLPLLVLALVFGIGISQYSAGKGLDFGMLVYLVPGMMVVLAFGLYMGLQRQKLLLKSYALTVSDASIRREQLQTPTIELPFSHIQEISKTEEGGFIIKGQEAQDIIIVPAQIKHAEELENLLQLIRPLERKPKKSLLQRFNGLLTLATLLFMATVYLATNKVLVGASGILFICIQSWSFLQIRQNKSIDLKTKRGMYWIILVIVSVVVVMYYKIVVQ